MHRTFGILTASLALSIFMSGCAQTHLEPISPSMHAANIPALNKIETREVGETIVKQSQFMYLDGFEIDSDYEYENIFFRYLVSPKTEFSPAKFQGFLIYCGQATTVHSITKNPISTNLCFDIKGSKVVFRNGDDTRIPLSNFTAKKIVQLSKLNTHRELVYTGKSGDSVYINYREFRNDFIQPAVTQDVTFDLSNGKVFGFQGVRLEILKATNTQITYKLLTNFTSRS